MKVVLFGFGSRGDVQPVYSLAQELKSVAIEATVVCTWPRELIRSTFGDQPDVDVLTLVPDKPDTTREKARGYEGTWSSVARPWLGVKLQALAAQACCHVAQAAGAASPRLLQGGGPCWADVSRRSVWRTPGSGPAGTGLVLQSYLDQPSLFTASAWSKVQEQLRTANLVAICEGGDHPAAEALALLLCKLQGIPAVPVSLFPRWGALLGSTKPPWLLAWMAPELYARMFHWSGLAQIACAWLMQILAALLWCQLALLQRCSSFIYTLGLSPSHPNVASFLDLASTVAGSGQPATWTDLAKARYTQVRGDTEGRGAGRGPIEAYSQHVVQPPLARCARTMHGAVLAHPPPSWDPPTALQQFLDAPGPPVVYFGSVCAGREREAWCLEAAHRCGCRAVLGFAPASGTVYHALYTDLFTQGRLFTFAAHMGDVPHTWLFSKVHLAVHHAGAGTVQAALHTGTPSVTLPMWGDQFLWAAANHRLQAGPPPLPLSCLQSSEQLVELVSIGVDNMMQYTRGARMAAGQMRFEDGRGSCGRSLLQCARVLGRQTGHQSSKKQS